MIIRVQRYGFGVDSTGGLLYLDGVHVGYTCEDERRPVKVQNETCIPAGRYRVKLRDAGGMNERYKKRFNEHKGMLHLQDVPNFTWIYIHPGNTDDDTSGCILVGRSSTRLSNGEYIIGDSTEMYREIYKHCLLAFENSDQVWVEVV